MTGITLDSCASLLQRNLLNNAYFSPHHRLLYVATPKVACTSMKWWFAELVGIRTVIERDGVSLESDPELQIHDTFVQVAPEYTGTNKMGLVDALNSAGYFRFCLVRNPYTRAFSAWQSKWLLREPLQADSYTDAMVAREFESAEDIRAAFEAFLQQVSAVDDAAHHDVHVAPQWELLDPQRIQYSAVGKVEDPSKLIQALAAHVGSAFRNPLSEHRSNVSLFPYSATWISDEAARLIRTIYAKDFELFGYDTAVPGGGEGVSGSALALGLRGIKLLRGRNARIGELIRRLSSLSKPDISVSTMQMFWTENQGSPYSEDLSVIQSYRIDGTRQSLQLFFDDNTTRVASIRLDPSSQPVAVVVHALSVETAEGKCIWRWNGYGDGSLLQNPQGAAFRQVHDGILVLCFNNDPHCAVAIPEQVLGCIGAGSRLRVEISGRPLLDVYPEVLRLNDQLIADLRRVAEGKTINGADDLGVQIKTSMNGVTTGLEEVAELIEICVGRHNQIMHDQAMRINSMREELLRAEAQLDLLKGVVFDGEEDEFI